MKICSVEGCTGKCHCKRYCCRHYKQKIRYGKILERTKFDPNTFWFDDKICYMQTYDQKNNPKSVVMIDSEDYEKVKDYKWYINTSGYVYNKTIGLLSRFIMKIPDLSIQVDHKLHNLLDNRKSQLRGCSHEQNCMNKHTQSNNISGYKGVSWFSQRNNWRARITYKNKTIYVGYYNTKEEAAEAYNQKAKELFGEFALTNKLPNTRRLVR